MSLAAALLAAAAESLAVAVAAALLPSLLAQFLQARELLVAQRLLQLALRLLPQGLHLLPCLTPRLAQLLAPFTTGLAVLREQLPALLGVSLQDLLYLGPLIAFEAEVVQEGGARFLVPGLPVLGIGIRGGGARPQDEDRGGDSTTVEVAAPIENVAVNIAESDPPQYFLEITSGLSDACHTFDRVETERSGTEITVTVINRVVTGDVMCAQVYETETNSVALGTDFNTGVAYTVRVNDETLIFMVQ